MGFPSSATRLLALATISTVFGGASAATKAAGTDVEIRWTEFGVPHVKAHDYQSLGFGYGHAVAADRLCTIADHFITLRGERSRWHGADGRAVVGFLPSSNLNSDLFYRVQLSDQVVRMAASELQPKTRDLVHGYVRGINAYVAALSESERQAACGGNPIPVVTEDDVVRAEMAKSTTKKAFHVAPYAESSASERKGGDEDDLSGPSAATRAALAAYMESSRGAGSNAWAYGGDVVEGGGAMVVANPHSPWGHHHWLAMHMVHLTIPGEIDVAGTAFSGIPVPVIGFNRDVSWSLTSAHSWFVLQAMDVDDSGNQLVYAMDGVDKPVEFKRVAIDSLEADGSVSTRTFEVPYTELGPIYRLPALPTHGRPAGWYAVTAPGDANVRSLNQFLAAARATDIATLVEAIEGNRGRGEHVIAGDRHGDVAFIEAGPVLDLDGRQLEDCRHPDGTAMFNILDGSRRACALRDAGGMPLLAPLSDYPSAVSRRIIHNTNNSYKYSVHGRTLPDRPFLFGDHMVPPSLIENNVAPESNLRLLMSTRRMGEVSADGVVTPEEALEVLFDNRNFAAEEWLDDILDVCGRRAVSAEARRGCAILAGWDRKNDSDSRGALLFHQFWGTHVGLIRSLLPPSNPADPFARQRLVIPSDAEQPIVDAIEGTMNALAGLGFDGSEPWGDVFRVATPDGPVPLHGGPIQQGILNVMEPLSLTEKGFSGMNIGAGHLHLVRWDDGEVVADMLLPYGQSDDLASPARAAQLKLLSGKRLYRFPFTEDELSRANIAKSLTLHDAGD